jgi:hypothetical protein
MKENDEIRMTNAGLMTRSEWVVHTCSALREGFAVVDLPRSASLLDLSNANGAYQFSLGQRPREVEPSQVEALKARFIQRWCLSQTESCFQRLVADVIRNPGALPQAYMRKAPMALKSQCLP